MKHILIIMLLLVSVCQAQFEGFFWGKARNTKIAWGELFQATDSLVLKANETYLHDTNDSLFTNMLYIDNRTIGTGEITFSLDAIDNAMDSACVLHCRYYDDKDVHPVEYWDSWHQIGGYFATGTLYKYSLADSSWWRPARGIQYRVIKYDADTDTARVNLGFYNN